MACSWHRQPYIPLRDRYKEGQEFCVRGESVTLIEVDWEVDMCLVRPHANPVNLVVVSIDALEEKKTVT